MRVAIIGGGAAGLMCAATIQESTPETEVFLIERNNGLGKKVIISGGGRCNVTTGIRDVRQLLKNYPRGSKFLTSAMYGFPPEAVYDWFESHGVPLKTQDDQRVFPVSDDGHDIVRVFEELFATGGMHVLLNSAVERVSKSRVDPLVCFASQSDAKFWIFLKNQDEPLVVDRLVLATGGQAYRHTGSTGDGYAFAQSLGHSLTSLAPSLSAFFTRETWPATLSGLSFETATLTAPEANQSYTGPFLFTHKGVSGPAVFALSSLVAFTPLDKEYPLTINIDLFPGESFDALCSRLDNLIDTEGQKQFKTLLGYLVPKSLVEIVLHECRVVSNTTGNQTPKADRERCLAWLKAMPLHIIQKGAGDEFVTAGGIPLLEVNPSTMESKICPGLFFAGEILDVDGFTGGFNLQASWAAGRLAGLHLLEAH